MFFSKLEKLKDYQYKIILIFIGILAFFTNLWVRQADLMESRNFITAREMVVSGNFLYPTLNGAYRFEKPPLPTWFVAFFMKITGNISSVWIMRIPVAIVSILLVLWMYKLIKRLTEDKFLAFVVSTVLATTFLIMKEGVVNSWDMFGYAIIFGAMVCLVEAIVTDKKSEYLKFAILFGMSLMTKGPVPIYGLFIPFFISYGIIYKWKSYSENWKKILLTVIIGVGIASIWPLMMIAGNRELFFEVMLKEKSTWNSSHTQGFFFYFNYVGLAGIWAIFSIGAICYPWSKKRITQENKKAFDFGIIFTVITLVLLSLVKMKKQRYGIPIYIAASIPTGILIYSYYMSKIQDLTKIDRCIFKIQEWMIKIILVVIPVVYYIYGVKKKNISIAIFILYILIYWSILALYIYILKNNKDNFVKITLIFSVIIMLIIQSISMGFMIQKVTKRKLNPQIQHLRVLQNKKMELPVYGTHYGVEDIWTIGRPIMTIEVDTNLPDKFIYIGPPDFVERDPNAGELERSESREVLDKHRKEIEEKKLENEKKIEEIKNEEDIEKSKEQMELAELEARKELEEYNKENARQVKLLEYNVTKSKVYYRFDQKKNTIWIYELERKKSEN